jgi:NADPH2:quinone reductase
VLVPTESPAPVAGEGQAVIAVVAADVLFLDTQIRSGRWRAQFPVAPPYVPGGAVAGAVLAVGAGVSADYWVGTVVVTRTVAGYAEQALATADTMTAVPDGLDVLTAAALAHDGPTALTLFEGAAVQSGEWVLVTGAAGGLGSLLVRLAHAAGARVIGAAGGGRKSDLIRELGADLAVDYTQPGWPDKVKVATGGAGVDVVFDGVGGTIGAAAFAVTAAGARFSAHGAPAGGFAAIDPAIAERGDVRVRGIEQVQFTPAESHSLTERALAEAAAGRLVPVVGQTFPLAKAADAHAAIEARQVVGKTLLLA